MVRAGHQLHRPLLRTLPPVTPFATRTAFRAKSLIQSHFEASSLILPKVKPIRFHPFRRPSPQPSFPIVV